MNGPGGKPAVEPMLRIRPLRLSIIAGNKARVSVTSEVMLSWIISSSRPASSSANAPLAPDPALLTRKSICRPAREASSMTRRGPSALARSAAATRTRTECAPRNSLASASSRSRLRATSRRSCLSAAKSFAYSAPSPDDAPVISAVPIDVFYRRMQHRRHWQDTRAGVTKPLMKARTLLFLIAAFAAVVLAFVGSTMVSQRAAREVRNLSLRISRDTAPGIESMATLRAEVRRVQTLVRGAGEQAGADLDKQIADARHQLDNAQLRFQNLPHFSPEERAIFPRLVANMRAFDEAVERALERARSGGGATPVRELLPYGDAAAKAAQEILDVDAREEEQMAARIETVHERADKLALQLDAVSAILAAKAAAMAVRAVRHMIRLQEQNRQLMERKAAELEQFAGRVAHDVLSPLSSVSLALSLVQKTSGQAAQNAEARGMTSLSRVRNVVDALLAFARAGAQPEPGAVAPVREAVAGLEDELRPAALAENVEFLVDPVPDCAVACAPGVLAVLLTNLVRNSLKYMGDSALRRVHLGVRARRNVVVFEIADSGPGVPEELGERIFEAYVRGKRTAAKRSGIGLGLATVKRLVIAHGGMVGVRRSHLGGALFWFELPRAEGECDPLSVSSTENPAHPA